MLTLRAHQLEFEQRLRSDVIGMHSLKLSIKEYLIWQRRARNLSKKYYWCPIGKPQLGILWSRDRLSFKRLCGNSSWNFLVYILNCRPVYLQSITKKHVPPAFQPYVFPVYLRNRLSYKNILHHFISVGTRIFQIWWHNQLILAKH